VDQFQQQVVTNIAKMQNEVHNLGSRVKSLELKIDKLIQNEAMVRGSVGLAMLIVPALVSGVVALLLRKLGA
jgi:cell division septum initiation protein DivIVA